MYDALHLRSTKRLDKPLYIIFVTKSSTCVHMNRIDKNCSPGILLHLFFDLKIVVSPARLILTDSLEYSLSRMSLILGPIAGSHSFLESFSRLHLNQSLYFQNQYIPHSLYAFFFHYKWVFTN